MSTANGITGGSAAREAELPWLVTIFHETKINKEDDIFGRRWYWLLPLAATSIHNGHSTPLS
jgi:hypothetical protein